MGNEKVFASLLDRTNFRKRLKKLKGKKIVVYGAGLFFQYIERHYELSELNILAISDRRFEYSLEKEFLGYKCVLASEIKELNPDIVVVATVRFVEIVENLTHKVLKHTKIPVEPIHTLPLIELAREVWRT